MTEIEPMTEDMVVRFRTGFERAQQAGIPEPTAMTLSTVSKDGGPTARTVLLKDMDANGFVFYTNLDSRKGRHLRANPGASLLFWWRETLEQVLVEGRAEVVTEEEADAYFATRPRGSQIGAWASLQSETLRSRRELLDRVARFEKEFEGREVPRPPHWSGYRVRPHQLEFWYGGESRLHERLCFELVDGKWRESLLYP